MVSFISTCRRNCCFVATATVEPCAEDGHQRDHVLGQFLFEGLFGRRHQDLHLRSNEPTQIADQVNPETQQAVFVSHDPCRHFAAKQFFEQRPQSGLFESSIRCRCRLKLRHNRRYAIGLFGVAGLLSDRGRRLGHKPRSCALSSPHGHPARIVDDRPKSVLRRRQDRTLPIDEWCWEIHHEVLPVVQRYRTS